MKDAVGDGWLYVIWGGLMVLTDVLLLLVMWKGRSWRERALIREQGS
jgi:hypothetical protein